MQKKLILLAGALTFLLLVNSSCSKNDSAPPATKTKTDLIALSPWKFDKATASGADISNNALLTCYKDNILTFAANLSGTINEGANVCASPAPATFNWSFQNAESLLRLSFTLFPGGSPDFTIVSLTETSLVLSQQMTIAPYPTTTIEVTFKH